MLVETGETNSLYLFFNINFYVKGVSKISIEGAFEIFSDFPEFEFCWCPRVFGMDIPVRALQGYIA